MLLILFVDNFVIIQFYSVKLCSVKLSCPFRLPKNASIANLDPIKCEIYVSIKVVISIYIYNE
jgi:hypothetical protein